MKLVRRSMFIALLAALILVIGCPAQEDEGSLEQAAEDMGEAMEDAAGAMEDAAEETKEGVEAAGEELKKAGEKAKEKVDDALDTDG